MKAEHQKTIDQALDAELLWNKYFPSKKISVLEHTNIDDGTVAFRKIHKKFPGMFDKYIHLVTSGGTERSHSDGDEMPIKQFFTAVKFVVTNRSPESLAEFLKGKIQIK